MEKKFLYKELSYQIIGAAMEVHRELGPGYLESVYETALAYEFKKRQLAYERQTKLTVRYKEIVAGDFYADFIVDDKIIVELKATKLLHETHEAQVLNYLKATGLKVGLLINFGTSSLEHRRRVL